MYKQILLAVDYDDEGSWRKALPLAVKEAEIHGAALTAVTVIPDVIKLPNLPANYGDGAAAHVKATVEAMLAGQGADIPVAVRQGSIYHEILVEAHAQGADLIILASSKGDFPDYLLGPNAARVVRHANCSVLIVRE